MRRIPLSTVLVSVSSLFRFPLRLFLALQVNGRRRCCSTVIAELDCFCELTPSLSSPCIHTDVKNMQMGNDANTKVNFTFCLPQSFRHQAHGFPPQATFYVDTKESSHLRGRKSRVPCANILGGGSSINFQMYSKRFSLAESLTAFSAPS